MKSGFEITRKNKAIKELNLIPLINIIFILLIFFMIAGRVEKVDTIKVILPYSKKASNIIASKKPVVIYIDKKERIAVNNDLVSDADFPIILKTILLESKDININVRADAKLPASKLIKIMNMLKNAGANNISVLTQLDKSNL